MANEIAKAESYKTGLQKITDTYSKSVVSSLKNLGISATANQIQCIALGIQKMNEAIDSTKLSKFPKTWKDIDPSSISDCLTQIALMEINLASYPAEGYVAIKGDKMTFAPQGEGYRSLVERFGRGVERVYEPWLVKEGDDFKYPHFKGIEIEPPEWTPKGYGKCIRVIYPIKMTDGTIQYLISEREQVKGNLLAHVSNNLTKGKDKDLDTYNALMKLAEKQGLDELLHNSDFLSKGRVSPAWKEPNCESMIIRKMKNNVLKNFPKDTSNIVIATAINDAERNDDESEPSPVQTIDATASEPKSVELQINGSLAVDPASRVASFAKQEEKPAQKKEDDDDIELPF